MRNTAFAAALTIALTALCACATPTLQTPSVTPADIAREAALQRKFALQKRLDQETLLHRVSYRLTTGAAALCGNRVTGALGLLPVTATALAPEYRAAAAQYFGIDDGITVAAIVPNSPASDAGFAPGDRILAVAGQPAPTTEDSAAAIQRLLTQSAAAATPITIVVARGHATIPLQVTPVRACDFPALIQDDRDINAFADGARIFVTTGLLNFVRSDEELAVALSHELSHNILEHITRQSDPAARGVLGLARDIVAAAESGITAGLYKTGLYKTGLAVGRMAHSIPFEQEADYEGLYLMRRAGFPIDTAAEYWRRVAAELPGQITLRSDHPTTAERFLALDAAAREIAAQEAAGTPLVPNILIPDP